MPEHTPGPWIATGRVGYGEREIRGAEDAEGYRLTVAIVCNAPGDENLANARLLAAAPELYAVLKEVEEWRAQDGDVLLLLKRLDTVIGPKARAALARAEGREAG